MREDFKLILAIQILVAILSLVAFGVFYIFDLELRYDISSVFYIPNVIVLFATIFGIYIATPLMDKFFN